MRLELGTLELGVQVCAASPLEAAWVKACFWIVTCSQSMFRSLQIASRWHDSVGRPLLKLITGHLLVPGPLCVGFFLWLFTYLSMHLLT